MILTKHNLGCNNKHQVKLNFTVESWANHRNIHVHISNRNLGPEHLHICFLKSPVCIGSPTDWFFESLNKIFKGGNIEVQYLTQVCGWLFCLSCLFSGNDIFVLLEASTRQSAIYSGLIKPRKAGGKCLCRPSGDIRRADQRLQTCTVCSISVVSVDFGI